MKTDMAKQGVNNPSKKGKIVWIILLIQLMIIVWLVVKETTTTSYKIAYVEISKVYDGFSLTKKLDEDFKRIQSLKQAQLDSVKTQLELMEVGINQGKKDLVVPYNTLKDQYFNMQTQVDKDHLALQNQYLEQISTQLNALVKEYGEKKQYDIILGANGEGSIMHGKEALNVTEDVIVYINNAIE